ncbi:MAG: hypothetical protein WBP55_05125 [Solirubrobacterales bacterium]
MFVSKRFKRVRSVTGLVVGLVLLGCGLAALPAVANAASTEYPGGNASTFATTNGGWQSSESYDGLCILVLTCPVMAGEYEGSGGSQGNGDGYLRTKSGPTTLAALLSRSTQKWHSPAFTYKGIGNDIPASLSLDLKKRSGFAALLSLGASADVSVNALNQSGGPDRTLIDSMSIGNSNAWQKVPEVALIPGSLNVGDMYVLEIETSVGGLAAVLPGGHVDYDDVVLTAADKSGQGGGNGGGNGGAGSVKPPPKVIPAGVGYFYKNRLFVRVKCPKRFKPRCRVKAVALKKKKRGKVMTKKMRANVKRGKFVRKGLRVKPKFRAKVRKLAKVKRKTLVLRMKVKSKRGKKKATVFHRLRVIQRRK